MNEDYPHRHIHRDTFTDKGCLGKMEGGQRPDGSQLVLETLEHPDPTVRLKPGKYLMERDTYYGGDGLGGAADYPCFTVHVPDRDGDGQPDKKYVKVHRGNSYHDTRGCPLVGLARDEWDDGLGGKMPVVLSSATAHNLFMESLEGWDFCWLTISEGDDEE